MKFKSISVMLVLILLLAMAGCNAGQQSSDESGEGQQNTEATVPAASLAGTYTYEEELPFGKVPWTLQLNEDGTYTLSVTKPNGNTYTYTGAYTADGDKVTTGTPAESTSDIEAGFFNEDYSCEWAITPDGKMTPVNEGAGGGMFGPPDGMDFRNISLKGDVEPASAIGNSYVYEEKNEEFGFTTAWKLTFNSESECTLLEPNDMMGDTTYDCTYTFADGQYTVTIVSSSNGRYPMSSMFDDNHSCVYAVWGDGDFKPANGGGAGMPGGMPGMPGMGGFSFDADHENVSYASNSASQVMNIYLAEQATGSDPVIVVVHGGGFKFGDQTMAIIEPIVKAGTENGYVVASVDYRKSGEATFPGALSDVKAAVRYLRANASEYGIDPDKIVVWGESAGAYLADMTALTSAVTALDGDVTENAGVSSAVSAMVSFYAPIEFYTMDDEFVALGDSKSANHSQNSFETDYLGIADMTSDKDGVYKSWWGTYKDQIPTGLKAWIQAGTADTNVPYTQSQNLASGLTEVLGADNVQFGLIEGAAHEDDAFYTSENLAAIFAFLADALK